MRRKKKTILVASILLVILAVGFGAYCVYGSIKLKQLGNMTFEEMLAYTTKDNQDAVITVGIIQNGEMSYKVYGENAAVLSPKEHQYEIGSITKTFTTSLFCKAVAEGKISLDDPLDKFLKLPAKSYYPTLKRMITHTSGYKGYYFETPMISNFLKGRNDFYGITEPMLLKRLGKVNLKDADYSFKYSNFGMAAVGAVLEQVYDKDYRTLMNSYVSDELGLLHTQVSDGSGDLGKHWEWGEADAYIPAGAIVSDISDMMKYALLQMQEKPEYLSMAHEPLAEVNATTATNEKMNIRMDAVAAGWIIDSKNNIIWHNGATGNYNSYLGFDQENQLAVVILSNLPPNYRIPATVMGIELLTSLQK